MRADRAASVSVVPAPVTDGRMAHCHPALPAEQTPSLCAAATVASVGPSPTWPPFPP